jgi:hypothetical protein
VGLFRRKPVVPDIPLDTHPAQDDGALRVAYDAALAGDPQPAMSLLAAAGADPDRRARHVAVLAETATLVPDPAATPAGPVDTTAAWTDRWAQASPDDPDALLVRAASLVARAWRIRGGGWASSVGSEARSQFAELAAMAVPLLERAAELVPQDPTPWSLRMQVARSLSEGRGALERYWEQVIARDPAHRAAHNQKLTYLCQKWYGSHEEMFAFARGAAASAPTGSPLLVLPLRAAAEWAMWEVRREGRLKDHIAVSFFFGSDDLTRDLDTALHRWFHRAPQRHALWCDDLNYLANTLTRAGRHADARAVFEALGPYAQDVPWSWMPGGRWRQEFQTARKAALRTAPTPAGPGARP